MLTIKLLGELSFAVDGQPVAPLRSRTAAALLVYVACQQRSFARSYLAEFFWEDHESSRALANLRTALKLLRRPFAGYLTITRQTLAFNHDANYAIDALAFEQQLGRHSSTFQQPLTEKTAAQLAGAMAEYRGDFLQGFHLPHASGFEEWRFVQETYYRRLAERGLRQLVQFYLVNARYSEGIDAAERLLAFNPLDEAARRQMMELLWRSGRRNAALQQYEELRGLLAEELDVAPMTESSALYERIRATRSQPRHNLPPHSTPFVGREPELQALQEDLSTPGCRLLTLLGSGGVGKTRLLVELGRKRVANYPGQFAHGVCYVPLVHLRTARFLATAIAEALNVTLSGSDEPLVDLLNYLREKEMLLLLDNFEHLLDSEEDVASSVNVISQILQKAPLVKMVVTSRVRLQLQEEWVFDLHGLPAPPPEWDAEEETIQEETAGSFAAMRLFLESACRLRRDFNPRASTLRTIAGICRLLDGVPLAIEMAASWIRRSSCAEILQQIEADLDFLQMPAYNVPPRHRSLRVVFDYSWKLLDENEAAAMRQLTVFQGSFVPDAARQIAGVSAATLTALVDKSLLQVSRQEPSTVYEMHELLRQYANEHLAQHPEERREAQAAHATFYAAFVKQRINVPDTGGHKAAYDQIAGAIDEIRAAWDWNLSHGHMENVNQSLQGLFYFYWARGWLQEGMTMAERAVGAIRTNAPGSELLLIQARMWQAEFYGWLGRYDDAADHYEQVVASCRALPARAELVFTLNGLGRIQHWQGAYQTALSTFEECLALAHRLEDEYWLSLSLNSLATTIAESQMDYRKAWDLYEESLSVSREIGDQYGSARALLNMGTVAQEQGHIQRAKQLYAESLTIYRRIEYRHGIGAALNYLGQAAYLSEDFVEARALIRESYDMNRESGNRRAMVDSLKQLGNVAREAGDLQQAKQRYAQALQLAQEMGAERLALEIILEAAGWLQRSEQPYEASILLCYIANHPRAGQELASAARRTTAEAAAGELSEKQYKRQAQALTLGEAVQLALGSETEFSVESGL